MKTFSTYDELKAAEGTELGVSPWMEVDQARVDQFAEATGDFQWIHVDPQRAASGPFQGTIAHGWLTAGLIPVLLKSIYAVDAKMGINYGVNRLRFPSPVPVGSKIRLTAVLKEVAQVGDAVQLVVLATIHCEGAEKPSVVAEVVSRSYL